MTIRFIAKCDLCGEECNTEYNGQEHALPVGWSSFSMHYPGGLGQQRHACKRCTDAIGNGRLPITDYFQSKLMGDRQIYPNPTSTVVSLGQLDKMTCKKSDTEQEY